MTGYSFTTPVWDGGAWVTPAVAEVRVTPAAAEVKAAGHANGPEDAVPGWEALNWPAHEDDVRRLRQRIFKAVQEGDLARARSLQNPMLRSWTTRWSACAGDAAQRWPQDGGDRRGGRPDRPGQDGHGGAGAPHHPVLAAPRGPAGVYPEGG